MPYQKVTRLHEARRLMLLQEMEADQALQNGRPSAVSGYSVVGCRLRITTSPLGRNVRGPGTRLPAVPRHLRDATMLGRV